MIYLRDVIYICTRDASCIIHGCVVWCLLTDYQFQTPHHIYGCVVTWVIYMSASCNLITSRHNMGDVYCVVFANGLPVANITPFTWVRHTMGDKYECACVVRCLPLHHVNERIWVMNMGSSCGVCHCITTGKHHAIYMGMS